ncbi:hypothetical protein MMC16_007215 [Acarospora aff. strigata]|nr:hypothetical protein [Acarospora aff. strigata]
MEREGNASGGNGGIHGDSAYDHGGLSLPTTIDPSLLLGNGGLISEDFSTLRQLEGTRMDFQTQQAPSSNMAPPLSLDWFTKVDMLPEDDAMITSQTEAYVPMAMSASFEPLADPFTAGQSSVSATFNAELDLSYSHAMDDIAYADQTLNFPCLPILPAAPISNSDPWVGSSKAGAMFSEDTHRTRQSSLKDTLSATVHETVQWISYDQSSFANNTIAPRPDHTCDPPAARKRGRCEPFTEAKRKKIAEMRKLKSCLLCRMMKKEV